MRWERGTLLFHAFSSAYIFFDYIMRVSESLLFETKRGDKNATKNRCKLTDPNA